MTRKMLLLFGILLCGCKQKAGLDQAQFEDSAKTDVAHSFQSIQLTRSASEDKDLEDAEYDLLGPVFGIENPRIECRKDSIFWVVSQKSYSRCLNMAKDYPDFFSGATEESSKGFSHKCVGVSNLPSEISELYNKHFLLQKQISPCSVEDSVVLAGAFGMANIARDADDETSCTIYDSVAVVDSSSNVNKARAKELGLRLSRIRQKTPDGAGEADVFEFSPYANVFVAGACKPRSYVESLGVKIDARFSVFEMRNR